jgi:hypothetical protein
MKMIAGYLENARKFERLATKESDPKLKAHFGQQALAYRQLATERAKKLGLPSTEGVRPCGEKTGLRSPSPHR